MKNLFSVLVGLFAFVALASSGIVPIDMGVDLGLNVEWVKGFTSHTDGLALAGAAIAGMTKDQMKELGETFKAKVDEMTSGLQDKIKENLEVQIKELETRITDGDLEGKGVSDLKEQSSKMSKDNSKWIDEIQEKVKAYADETNAKFEKLNKGTYGEAPTNFGAGLAKALEDSGMTALTPKKTAIYNFKQFKDISVADADAYSRQRVPGIVGPAQRQLRVRDLLPVLRTNQNTVYFVRETALTDNAGPQTLASAKGETTFNIDLTSDTVKTLAHFIQVPLQILDDVEALEDYINSRMLFLLDQEEEDQLVYGSGTGQNLNGLITQATAYDVSLESELGVTDGTDLDHIRLAMAQVQVAEYAPSGILMHPYNWAGIELLKESTRGYIFASPQAVTTPTLWGLPVVATTAVSSPDFLVGAFNIGAAIWDRQQSSIAISTEDSDNFQRNLATIRAEKREVLTVYRTLSFVQGDFDNTVT